jgi:rhodanese-related sulfurtransferase
MKTLTTQELRTKMARGTVALFDVRGDLDFEEGHIPGSMSAPPGSLNFRVADVMNPDSQVIVYDCGRGCGLTEEVTERLKNLRMRNVVAYKEGLKGWRTAGLPVVPSVDTRLHARGPVTEIRRLVVDREQAYAGAFKHKPVDDY